MTQQQKPTAIQKRAANKKALAPFALSNLWSRLPLTFPFDPDLPPSPKPRYRSQYRYLGPDGLDDAQTFDTLSSFDIALRLIDYSHLEPLLAAHIYLPSAKGQTPFYPVSMYLLSLYRRERNLSRHKTLRILKSEDGRELRRRLGFQKEFPSESGFRYPVLVSPGQVVRGPDQPGAATGDRRPPLRSPVSGRLPAHPT